MNRDEIYLKWQTCQNYIIIGVVSLFFLFFLPMIGSTVGLDFVFPDTPAGWVVYVVSKLMVSALNLIIFHCFTLQGKVNAKDNPNYLAANDILSRTTPDKAVRPRSPKQYMAEAYGKKGTAVFFATLVAAIGLTQAVLTFDWVSMLTYLFTIVMGIIFGIFQMNKVELFWTEEYLQYAKMIEEEQKNAKIEAEREAMAAASAPVVEENSVALASPQCAESANDSAGTAG